MKTTYKSWDDPPSRDPWLPKSLARLEVQQTTTNFNLTVFDESSHFWVPNNLLKKPPPIFRGQIVSLDPANNIKNCPVVTPYFHGPVTTYRDCKPIYTRVGPGSSFCNHWSLVMGLATCIKQISYLFRDCCSPTISWEKGAHLVDNLRMILGLQLMWISSGVLGLVN